LDDIAFNAAKGADNAPIEQHLRILLFLLRDRAYERGQLKPQEWAELRASKTGLLLRGWQRLEEEMNRPVLVDGPFFLNVQPPREAGGLPAGVSPLAVKDPEMRAAYEKSLAMNRARTEAWCERVKIERLAELFQPLVEKYVVQAYGRPPLATEELDQLLRKHLKDEALKSRILRRASETARKPN
jgi:hypothetical protein